MGATTGEVVVVATKYSDFDSYLQTFRYTVPHYVYTFNGDLSQYSPVQGYSSPGHHEILKQVNSTSNQSTVDNDANALAKAVSRVDDAFSHLDLSKTIQLNGQTITLGQLKGIWDHWTFVVSDGNFATTNGGVGAITSDGSGGYFDTISINGFNNGRGSSGGGYDDPNYLNDQGLTGILLHEVSHEIPGAEQQQADDNSYYYKDKSPQNNGPWINSPYWVNNEKWANDGEAAFSSALGIDESQYDAAIASGAVGYGWQPAQQIYNSHQNNGGGAPDSVSPDAHMNSISSNAQIQ